MAQDQIEQQDDPNLFLDLIGAPMRGIEQGVRGAYGLGDFLVGDILPDWDRNFMTEGVLGVFGVDESYAAQSQTFAGGIVEGASQFLTGFIPFFSIAGKVGAVAKAGSLTQKVAQNQLARSTVAGIAADFTAFSEQEQRLSNFIQQYPGLQNPITEFLATKEDDTVLEGRLKNALEGLGLGLLTDVAMRGIKSMKRGIVAKGEGKGADEVATAMRNEFDGDTETFINQIHEGKKEQPPVEVKTIEEELDDVIAQANGAESKAPKETPKTIEVNFTDGKSVELKDKKKAAKVKQDAQALIGKMLGDDYGVPEGIAGGDKVKDFVPADIGLYDSDEEAVALIKELKIEFDKKKTVSPEIRSEEIRRINAGEGKKVLEEKLEHLPKDTRDAYLLGTADDVVQDLGEHLDFIDVFRTVYTEKVRALQTVYKQGELTMLERKGNVAAYLDTIWQYMSREQQLARRMGQGLRDVQTFRMGKVKKNPVHELQAGGRDFAEQFLRERKQKWIDQVVDILERGGSEEQIMKKVLNIANNTKGGKLDMLREFWINNLLAGLPTQMTNIFGGGLTSLLSGFEQSIGSLMTGRPDLAKAVIKHAVDTDTWMDSFRWASESFKKDDAVLIPSSRPMEVRGDKAITSDAIGIDPDSEYYKTFNQIANVLRLPSRGLTTADEFFKQLNARRAAKYKATIEAIDQGINDPKGIAKYVQEKLEKVITQGGELYSQHTVAKQGFMAARQRELSDEATIKFVKKYVKKNFDKNISALSRYAKDVAEEVTMTKELDPKSISGTFHKFVSSNPVMSFVFPFIRTPVNILTYAVDRSIFGVINPRNIRPLLADLKSANPATRAAAAGKATTTGIAMAAHYAAFTAFSDRLSGGGPRDPKARKQLEDSGWQPYSIRIGDKWISYQRLDPLATVIGVYADMIDLQKENWEANKGALERISLTLLITLQRNITNKSYLAGMEQFTTAMSDESGRGIERLFGNVAVNSTIPLAGFWRTTGKGIVGEIMDENDMKEIRNFMDRYKLYSPTGAGARLDPQRNLLGESKQVEDSFGVPFANAISPIKTRTQKDDLVLQELAALDHGFTNPSPSYRGLIDLTGYENNKGQSAHDRRLELMGTVQIGGKTLRQALEKLIKSSEYQQMSPSSEPGLPSPRIRMINSILSRYRAEGLSRALKEYPELNDFHRQYKEVQRQQRRGAELDNLIQTLNF